MTRSLLAAAAATLLLSACVAAPRPVASGPEQQARPNLRVECREAADRTVTRQDRGQLLREDERNARLGSETGSQGFRTTFDTLGRQYRRDNLAADCERRNGYTAPSPQPGANAPAPAPAR